MADDARDPLADRLAQATLTLVDIPSPSHEEREALDACAARLAGAGVPLRWWGDDRSVLFAGHLAGPGAESRPLVTLAGHLDTVPAQGNLPGRIEGDRVQGLGASDMKGAVAVIVELLADLWPEGDQLSCAVGAVLFAREELPFGESALSPALLAESALSPGDPRLQGGLPATAAALGVVMEPTSGGVQGGCLGNINATVTFTGRSAHSARPWEGENALTPLGSLLTSLGGIDPVEHTFSGLTYAECVTATRVSGGVARNVVPGTATVDVNYRYPPGMAPATAEAQLGEHLAGHGATQIIGHAPSGAVTLEHPLAQRLIALTGTEPTPKQAWTPVAEFTAVGVDAVNFGPGEPAQAHQVHESVSAAALASSYRTLATLLRLGTSADDPA